MIIMGKSLKQQRFSFQISLMASLKYSPQSESNPQNNFFQTQNSFFIKDLLKRLDKYNDQDQLSLEESIPILYELNIFQELTSIPEAKKRLMQQEKSNHRLQLEARFIYNLWKIIGRQFIFIKQFKDIVALFITEESFQIGEKLKQIFTNEGTVIIDILAIWQAMLSYNSRVSSQDLKQSLIQSKYRGHINSSLQNNFRHGIMKKQQAEFNNYSSLSIQQNDLSLKRYEKENDQYLNFKNQSIPTERLNSKTRRQNIEEVKNQIYNSNFYEIPTLTVERQKQLINRLYVINKYERYTEIKKMQDQEKILKQLEECTFRPNIQKAQKKTQTVTKNKSKTQSKPIPGFQKAIERMKIGQQKTKQLKQKLQLRNTNIKENKEQPLRQLIPPKFLTRSDKKEEKKVLFSIQFDIGRHQLSCKIHENDSAELLAKNIQSIYSLKRDSYQQIKTIIDQEMQKYFQLSKDQEGTEDEVNHQKNMKAEYLYHSGNQFSNQFSNQSGNRSDNQLDNQSGNHSGKQIQNFVLCQ